MNVRQVELTRPVVEITLKPDPAAPVAALSEGRFLARAGALPLLALGVAVIATVGWIGFLLWEAVTFIFGLLGL